MHVYELRPRKDHRGVDLISASLSFGRLWYSGPNASENAIGYAKFRSRSHDAVIRVYDDAGNAPRKKSVSSLRGLARVCRLHLSLGVTPSFFKRCRKSLFPLFKCY